MRTEQKSVFGLTVAVFVSLIILSGCATKVPVTMLKPGHYHEAATAKKIAVLPFNGSDGAAFGIEIENTLASVVVKNKPHFTIANKEQVDRAFSELKLSKTSPIDEAKAAQIGNMLGVQGIYTGTVSSAAKDSSYSEERNKCVQYVKKRDKDGNLYETMDCARWNTYNVECTKRVAEFSTTPTLISVKSAKVIYSKDFFKENSSSSCSDEGSPEEAWALIEKLKTGIKSEFTKDVAPYYVTVQVKLLDSKDGIDSKEAKNLLDSGVDFASKQRLDEACELWGQAMQIAPNSVSLNYNLAICSEAAADYPASLKLFQEAERLSGKGNEDIDLGMQRVLEALKNQNKLDEQLKG
jgi:tetratricopeptide (TPR) repeat protein